jgi:nucleolar protein 58
LRKFHNFADTTEALQAVIAMQDGSLSDPLRKFLKKNVVDKDIHEKLVVSESKLGGTIKKELGIECRSDAASSELMRCIRSQLDALLTDVAPADARAMSLGLAHSLSRFKLKFSPDKIDTMVIQAICKLGVFV